VTGVQTCALPIYLLGERMSTWHVELSLVERRYVRPASVDGSKFSGPMLLSVLNDHSRYNTGTIYWNSSSYNYTLRFHSLLWV
jgi:hypothetical protein